MKYRWSHRHLLLAAAVSSLTLCGAALADSTANLTVTASVVPSCTVSATTLAFGPLNPSANNDQTAAIQWQCTKDFSTVIKLGAGGSGTIAARSMGGAAALPYQLYTDATHSTIFGDGTTGSAAPVTGVGYSGPPGNVTVYGRVLQANAAVAPAGSYTDTVQITIVF